MEMVAISTELLESQSKPFFRLTKRQLYLRDSKCVVMKQIRRKKEQKKYREEENGVGQEVK